MSGTAKVRQQLRAAADSPLWTEVDGHLAARDWSRAIDALQKLANEVIKPHRALGRLAQQVNRKHWSPLLESGATVQP